MRGASAWRRPVVLTVGVVAVPAALAVRTWRRSERLDGSAAGSTARGMTTGTTQIDSLPGWLPAADAGPRAWGSLAAAAATPGLAIGLAIGLAPLTRPGADPISSRHLQGAALGVVALGIATALVGAGGWLGKLVVYGILDVQDSSGFIDEMRVRVPVLAQFWQQQIGPLKAALEPVTVTMGGRFQAVVDSIGLEELLKEQLGLDISVDEDNSDPLGELGDDPLQTLVDRASDGEIAEVTGRTLPKS